MNPVIWIRWALTTALVGSAGWVSASMLAPAGSATAAEPAPELGPPTRIGLSSEGAESVSVRLRAAAPFRPDRSSLASRSAGPAPVGPAPGPRPALVLTAIAWGSSPAAVVAGLPGTDRPRVVRVGDTAGGLSVRAITRLTVYVVGPDTAWVLRLGEETP